MHLRFISLSLAFASCQGFAPSTPHATSVFLKKQHHQQLQAKFDPVSLTMARLYENSSHTQRLTNLFLSQIDSNNSGDNSNDVKETASKPSVAMGEGNFDVSELKSQMTQSMSKVMDNMSSGEFGTRGELYVAGQFALILFIFYGDIPLVGETLKLLFGPGMFLLGGVVAGLGVKELGSNISPFPKVGDNADLVTDGIFGQIRHPIYAGLLYSCVGISVWSGSAARLVLTAALWFLLTKKSDFEERTLVEKFPAYEYYLEEVEGKFIPASLLKSMPWVDKD